MTATTNIRIVFMGTPDFAVHMLKGLIKDRYNVVGVVTAPDRPAGRGQKIKQSAVKIYAQEQGLNILQPTNLKSTDFIAQLSTLKANLQVVVAFRMLPKVVWEMPALGTFNLHASLLPQYRGAAPINWALINGESETGVTTFYIDDKIDTGAIILQSKVSILEDDTAGSLHDKLMEKGQELILKTINQIECGSVATSIQTDEKELKTAHKLHKNNCKIDWSKSGVDIQNLVRGLNPYPGAWALLKNGSDKLNIKIYKVKYENNPHSNNIGTVITNKTSIVICIENGYIHLTNFKFPGKKQMDVKAFLNGFKFDTNAKMI